MNNATLNADASPQDLVIAVTQPGYNVATFQVAATAAYQTARNLQWAPVSAIDDAWRGFQNQTTSMSRMAWRTPTSADLMGQKTSLLKIALTAKAHYDKIIADHAAMPDDQRRQVWDADRNAASQAVLAKQDAANIAWGVANAPKWSAAEFIAKLAQRGIGLHTKNGKLMAINSAALTPADASVLTAHKAEIIAALANAVEVA